MRVIINPGKVTMLRKRRLNFKRELERQIWYKAETISLSIINLFRFPPLIIKLQLTEINIGVVRSKRTK